MRAHLCVHDRVVEVEDEESLARSGWVDEVEFEPGGCLLDLSDVSRLEVRRDRGLRVVDVEIVDDLGLLEPRRTGGEGKDGGQSLAITGARRVCRSSSDAPTPPAPESKLGCSLFEAVFYRCADHHELWFQLEIFDDGVVWGDRLSGEADELDAFHRYGRQRPDQDLEVIHTASKIAR